MLRSRRPLETSSSRFVAACLMTTGSAVPSFMFLFPADTLIFASVPRCEVFQPHGSGRPGSEESRPDVLRFVIGGTPFEARGV